MKIRKGFVSNSSSSSFIIGANPNENKVTVSLEMDLNKLSEQLIKTIDEAKEYIIDEYYLHYNMDQGKTFEEALVEENIEDVFETMKMEIDKGNVIYVGSVGNDYKDPLCNFLYERGFPLSDNYRVIKE